MRTLNNFRNTHYKPLGIMPPGLIEFCNRSADLQPYRHCESDTGHKGLTMPGVSARNDGRCDKTPTHSLRQTICRALARRAVAATDLMGVVSQRRHLQLPQTAFVHWDTLELRLCSRTATNI
jgi:hypothetical protein